MDDRGAYIEQTLRQYTLWENKCHRCGACCGALEDPCENLHKDINGKYYCNVYDLRYGKWHTVSGKELNCVPIREKLAQGHSWPGDMNCGYKNGRS